MRGEIETRLGRGIEAAKAGEKERARDILIHVIELDQYNEQAWLWLSAVVDTLTDKRVCLENVLFINPDNVQAATDLQRVRQQPKGRSTAASAFPRLAVSRALAGWKEEEEEEREEEQRIPPADVSPRPTRQVCLRCGYRNPGWVYVCDRCGADLRPVNLRQAVSTGAKPRGRNFATLLEAWGGALIFSRFFAFQPEIELASWGRSLAALVMAVIFASAWRAITTVVLHLMMGAPGSVRRVVSTVLRCTAETLPPTLLLVLVCVPVALVTWVGARLVGGRQGFKTHAHLTAVAFSAWVILIPLLASLFTFVSYLIDNRLDLIFEAMPPFIGVAVGLIGIIWLTQALQTAYHLPGMRAILAMLLGIALSIVLLFGLALLSNKQVTELMNMLQFPLLPCSS